MTASSTPKRPGPKLKGDAPVTPYQSRQRRVSALKDAGGWVGIVELSPEAWAALKERQRPGQSISDVITAALLA